MSSAQAAAAAAFLGTKAPAAPAAHKRRPLLRLRTNLGLLLPKTPTPGGSVGPETPGSRTQALLGAPSPPENKAKGGRAAAGTSTNTSPASPPAPAPRQPPAAQNDGAYTPGSGASRATRGLRGLWSLRGPRTPMGAGEDAGALGGGYFGLPRSASVSLHDGNSDTPRAARLASTKPQDMLEQVRLLISAKLKSGTQKDAARKSQLAVSEFRQRVDLRMVLSQPAPPGLCLRAGADEDASLACSSGRGSESGLFFHPAAAQSRVSVGSAVSDASADAPDSRLSCPDGASLAALRKTPPAPSPIPIPLSSQGVDRGLAAAPEGLAKLLLAPGLAASASSESVGDPCLLPAKPGRKKPPSSHDCESVRETSGLDIEYSGPGLDASDFDTDDSESVKFPLFPGLSSENHHHHRIGLFSKKKTKRDRGVVYDPEPPRDDASELSLAPAPSPGNSLAVVHQPVKLRSTMRKKDKRKERKTAFNEDKPWKNHGDLDVISDSQRKRYEGLWVSNKGLYLDRVATKLLGVDYERQEDSELSKSMREYSEREISERAAQLSASLNVDFDLTDARELHGLDCVSMLNLIHGSVVKKLWSRSNLPRETLQAIWDLVDFRKDGTLNKAEFIVGMWLVDQRLYGRKLPKVVNKLVWSSLGGLGVNVVIKKKRR